MNKLITSALLALSVAALQAAEPAKGKTLASPLPVPANGSSTSGVQEKIPSSENSSSGVSFTLGGGYVMPLSNISDVFKPSWGVRLTARNNNVSDTLFGIGFDLSYSALKDKDVSGGRMIFASAVPHVTASFSLFDLFDINAKGGPGISALISKVNGTSGGSAAFTLCFGGGISRVFGRNFIIGLEGDYYYYMQRNPSSTAGCYLYMGYRM